MFVAQSALLKRTTTLELDMSIHDTLRKLNVLVSSAGHDVQKYLEAPHEYSSEYFEDVHQALVEAQHLVVEVRTQISSKNVV